MNDVIVQVCDGLFWLSLTFVAVLGVVTTIASNFIGRIRQSVEAEKTSQEKAYNAELKRISDDIRNSKTIDGKALSSAGKILQDKQKEVQQKLRKLEMLSSVLEIKNAVVLPGSLLLSCFVLANAGKVAPLPWSLPIAIVGFLLICAASAISVRNFILLGTIAAIQSPKLVITHDCASSWKAGLKSKISVTTLLERGSSLHSLQVILYLPPCFKSTASFIGKLKRSPDDYLMPNYETIASNDWPLLKMDLPSTYDFGNLSCSQRGNHKLFYRIVTAEFTSEYKEIDLI